ncbi:hypothetical protein [uncultured Xanthomonas sp.]|uniref:hypothetical protein n=1 Tax=uncultured Xanthomonas sp. TaxID=152831 RepID=UPI0025F533BD|nr:hypothetical protein [uncultured Xanthomonas sp.]
MSGRKLASLEPNSWQQATDWLRSQNYESVPLDFSTGISPVVAKLGLMLNWESEFGYQLDSSSRNLAALHDGFDFQAPEVGGLVLELIGFETALSEDGQWCEGFLAIIIEHSIRQLALGRRFFALVALDTTESSLIGMKVEQLCLPYPFPFRELRSSGAA